MEMVIRIFEEDFTLEFLGPWVPNKGPLGLTRGAIPICFGHQCLVQLKYIFNRPGVAGAVLQSASSLID